MGVPSCKADRRADRRRCRRRSCDVERPRAAVGCRESAEEHGHQGDPL